MACWHAQADHNTLWRFWNQNRKAIKKLFKKTVQLALNLDLIEFVFHALDGTKIMSVGSRHKILDKKDLTKRLEKVNKAIEEILDETAKSENNKSGEYKLDEKLQEQAVLKKTIEAGLLELELEGTSKLHPKDRDARMMKMKSGNKEMCYNTRPHFGKI